MVLRTNGDAPKAIMAWIVEWFDLLARGEIAEACARLDEPNRYERTWTAEQIAAAVEDTFDPQSRFARAHPEGLKFTRPDCSAGDPFANIDELADGSGYWAEYNVPISGEFSDLTAQFRFRRAGNKLLASLHDLHVL